MGQVDHKAPKGGPVRTAVALAEVSAVHTRRLDGPKTMGFVLGTAVAGLVLFCAFAEGCYLFHEDPS